MLKPSPSSNLSVHPVRFLLMSAATMQRDEEGEEGASLTSLTTARKLEVNGREFSYYRAVSQRKWVMVARKPPAAHQCLAAQQRPVPLARQAMSRFWHCRHSFSAHLRSHMPCSWVWHSIPALARPGLQPARPGLHAWACSLQTAGRG